MNKINPKYEQHKNNQALYDKTIVEGVTGKQIHFTKKSEYITFYQENPNALNHVINFIEEYDKWIQEVKQP